MIPDIPPKKEKKFWKFMKEILFVVIPAIIARIKITKRK